MNDDPPDPGTLLDPAIQMDLIRKAQREADYEVAEANFVRCTCRGCNPDPNIQQFVRTTIHEVRPRRSEA